MKTLLLALVLLFPAEIMRWPFEDAQAGKLPDGWRAQQTGQGEGSVWKVLADNAAHNGLQVMAQTASTGPAGMYNLCVCNESNLKDLQVAVAVKAVEGKIDRGGGPIWRYQDANNYYICRWNPLENNFRVYKVVEGKRTQLATAAVKAAADTWHVIRVVHASNRIRCYLDEEQLLNVDDDTIQQAGKAGLWTKADAVTHFDDFEVRTLSE